MAGLMKRLFGGREPEFSADEFAVAGDEWSPVPVSATAQAPNVMGWLQEQPRARTRGLRAGQSSRPRRHTIQRMYKRLSGLIANGKEIEPESAVEVSSSAVEERDDPTMPMTRSLLDDRDVPTLPWQRTAPQPEDDPTLPNARPASTYVHQASPALAVPSSSSKPRSVVGQAARVGEDTSPHGSDAEPCDKANNKDDDWVNVLKQYGEHLTDEELKIIKQQLA